MPRAREIGLSELVESADSRLIGAPARLRLVGDVGQGAAWCQDRVFHSLSCKRLDIDLRARLRAAGPGSVDRRAARSRWPLSTDAALRAGFNRANPAP
jgi:hypothetical protein